MAYEGLLRPGEGSGGGRAYVDDGDGRARRSVLVERLTGRELDAPGVLPLEAAWHPSLATGALADDELLVIVRWIELGAPLRDGQREAPLLGPPISERGR